MAGGEVGGGKGGVCCAKREREAGGGSGGRPGAAGHGERRRLRERSGGAGQLSGDARLHRLGRPAARQRRPELRRSAARAGLSDSSVRAAGAPQRREGGVAAAVGGGVSRCCWGGTLDVSSGVLRA